MTSANRIRPFASTHWSLIAAAGKTSSPECRRALSELCETYWHPLYAYVRRKGFQTAEAQDLTQSFFVLLLEKQRFQVADRSRGRFRTFLLASLDHFLANEWRAARAAKRGGGATHRSLDFAAGETAYAGVADNGMTPQQLFEHRWAMTLLDNAVTRVRDEYQAAGKERLFEALKAHLGGDANKLPYAAIAEELRMTEGAVKVAAHRLRNRCREVLRGEVGQTVAEELQIDEEIQHLFRAVQSTS